MQSTLLLIGLVSPFVPAAFGRGPTPGMLARERVERDMPRLFTAIELPEALREDLSALEAPLPGAHWTHEDNLHITLRFAGDVDNRMAD